MHGFIDIVLTGAVIISGIIIAVVALWILWKCFVFYAKFFGSNLRAWIVLWWVFPVTLIITAFCGWYGLFIVSQVLLGIERWLFTIMP